VWVNRYIVKKKLGKGSFGQVVQAVDKLTGEHVAIKIVKSKNLFLRQARLEIDLLKQLNELDPHDQSFIVRLKDTFIWRNHQCLTFEMLSYNLYELLRNTSFNGVSLNLISKFAKQILKVKPYLPPLHKM
jgi:serine/threonine protein kinase